MTTGTATGIRRTGRFEVCPVLTLRGDNDGDAHRSSELSDGRIENIFVGYSHPVALPVMLRILKEPLPIRNLAAELIHTTTLAGEAFTLAAVNHQLDGRDLGEVDRGLALNGVDASALDNTTVRFNNGTCLQSLTITYDGQVEQALADRTPGSDPQGILADQVVLRAPARILTAAEKLVTGGFTVVAGNFDSHSLRTICFRKGDGAHAIRAELTWIV